MKKNCGLIKQDLMRWIDGELEANEVAAIVGHLEGCASCRQEAKVFQRLNEFLRDSQENIEVSSGFETVFWSKVSRRQRSPLIVRILNGLEALIPVPNFRQAVAFVIVAFMIGNVGGFASALRQKSDAPISWEYNRGISSYSLTGAYLNATEKEIF